MWAPELPCWLCPTTGATRQSSKGRHLPGGSANGRPKVWRSSSTATSTVTTPARHRQPARLRAKYMTAGEGEFLGLSQADASARIREGRSLIEDIIGRPIDGFVAPAWLYGAGALQALSDEGVPLAEDHFRIWSPATGRKLAGEP